MRLFAGKCDDFFNQVSSNRLPALLADAHKRQLGRAPIDGMVRSWENSLPPLSLAAQGAGLEEQGVVIEFQLPSTGLMLDVMFCGANGDGADAATIVELKQWDACEPSDGEHIVTWTGGGERDVLHPSVQADKYRLYLEDGNTAFHEEGENISLSACAFLHNYDAENDDPLLAAKFNSYLGSSPLFLESDTNQLSQYIASTVGAGPGDEVLKRVLAGKPKASRKLLEHVGKMLDGESEFILLDDQQVACDRVLAEAKRAIGGGKPATVLVRGGPGTGKSVVALNLLARLAGAGHEAHYVTGSKAFTTALRDIAGKRPSQLFRYFNQYSTAAPESIDVLICDEAHRIRETSVSRYTPKHERSGKSQTRELIDCSKVSVFFIDDLQSVRPSEVGSAELIRQTSTAADRPIYEHELKAQFRCAGSDGFINWVTDVLDIDQTANPMWNEQEAFEFRILETPHELLAAIREKADSGATARVAAGFCWPWSNPLPDGNLVDDVVIGDFVYPWNAPSNKGKVAKGIPKEGAWARHPAGINQVGCIYTAQGFEFDYVGVIFGPDLVWRDGCWVGNKDQSHDGEVKKAPAGDAFADLVKNTYRVLLTRGMKGCYVHFMDPETEEHWRSRIGKSEASSV